jgi:hypothetical protein
MGGSPSPLAAIDGQFLLQEVAMFRPISVALGIGLIILWIAALSGHAVGWLTWLDGLAGLVAIALGLTFTAQMARAGTAGWGLLALSLFALWIVALAAGSTIWLAWWTFAFACAFLILAASATAGQGRLHLHQHQHRTV